MGYGGERDGRGKRRGSTVAAKPTHVVRCGLQVDSTVRKIRSLCLQAFTAGEGKSGRRVWPRKDRPSRLNRSPNKYRNDTNESRPATVRHGS